MKKVIEKIIKIGFIFVFLSGTIIIEYNQNLLGFLYAYTSILAFLAIYRDMDKYNVILSGLFLMSSIYMIIVYTIPAIYNKDFISIATWLFLGTFYIIMIFFIIKLIRSIDCFLKKIREL